MKGSVRFSTIFGIGGFLLWIFPISAQTVDKYALHERRLETLFLQDRLDLWPSEWTAVSPEGFEELYRRALERYGYVGWQIGKKNLTQAEVVLKQLETELADLRKLQPRSARLWALQGAVYGFRIALQPWRLLELGPQSLNAIETAQQIEPTEPIVQIEAANALRYRPEIFGGSVEGAARIYQDALRSSSIRNRLPRWLIWSTNLALAACWEEKQKWNQAKDIYRSLLEEEPTFPFVKNVALPRVEKMIR